MSDASAQEYVAGLMAVLRRTPDVLSAWLTGLPDVWLEARERDDAWSPLQQVDHLIHGERTDWMPRLTWILAQREGPFVPFDRDSSVKGEPGATLVERLSLLATLRAENLARLEAFELSDEQLALTGTHPALGTVTARQLLSTWTVHDVGHLRQIGRCLAVPLRDEVGPWGDPHYLPVMGEIDARRGSA